MANYDGFRAVVAAVERVRDDLSRVSSDVANNLGEIRGETDKNLAELKRPLVRFEWELRRLSWSIQKAFRPQPTAKELAQKEFKENLQQASPDNRALAIAFRAALQENSEDLKGALKDLENAVSRDSELTPMGIAKGVFSGLGSAIIAPFEALFFGAFEGIGEEFTKDFSRNLVKQIQKSSLIDFGDIGKDVGQAAGAGLQKGVLDFIETVQESIKSESDDVTPHIGTFLEKTLKNIFLSLGKSALAIPRAYQRMQYQRLAVPEVLERAGQMMIDDEVSDEDRKKIEASDSITLVVGGVNMDATAGNTDYVSRMMDSYLEGSHVVPVKNLWSNAPYDDEFKVAFQNLVKSALNNPLFGGMIIENIKENVKKMGKDSDFKGLSEEDFNDKATLSAKILDIMAKKDMPIGKGIEALFKGYNPDDVEIAAKALFYQQQFPNKPVNIIGTSFGGFNAAGAVQLLNMLGVDDIKGAGITTPFTGMLTPPDPENFLGSIGDEDFLYQIIEQVLGELKLTKEFQQVVPGAGKGHTLPHFITEPKFRGRLQSLLKNRARLKRGLDSNQAGNYFSNRNENPEDQNMINTMSALMGEDFSGYAYDVESLKGYRHKISKKRSNIIRRGDVHPELLQELDDYMDFLDTLIKELEELSGIDALGVKGVPKESIKKAQGVIKGAEKLVNHPQGDSDEIVKAASEQAKGLRTFLAFRKKMRSEVKNFSATLTAMQGKTPKEGWAFFDQGEEADKRFEALDGFIKWLESDFLKGASDVEKELSAPFLDFMKKMRTVSTQLKEGGSFDASLLEDFDKLFGSEGQINKVLTLKIKENIKETYTNYLKKISTRTEKNVNKTGLNTDVKEEFAGLNEAGQKDFIQGYLESIKTKAGSYRSAFQGNDKRATVSEGEGLLSYIATVRKIYLTINKLVKDGSPLQKDLKALKGQITAVYNEVLQGSGTSGRIPKGLPDLVAEIEQSTEGIDQAIIEEIKANIEQLLGDVSQLTPTKSTSQKYEQYLNKLILAAKEKAQKKLSAIVPKNFADLPGSAKEGYIKSHIVEVGEYLKEYRRVVQLGDRNLALKAGEFVLQEIQQIRQIYESLSKSIPKQPKKIRQLFSSVHGRLTSIENEVLEGSSRRGSTQSGLLTIVGDAEKAGGDLNEGFLRALEEKIGEIEAQAEEIGQAAIEGLRKGLEAQSPSRASRRAGLDFIAGWVSGVRGNVLGKTAKQLGTQAVAGFSSSFNKKEGQSLGAAFGEGTEEGAKEALDIRSPSEVFKNIGKNVRDAFTSVVENIGPTTQKIFEDVANFSKEATDGLLEGLQINIPEENLRYAEKMIREGIENAGGAVVVGFEDLFNIFEEKESVLENIVTDGLENIFSAFEQLEEQFPVITEFREILVHLIQVGTTVALTFKAIEFVGNIAGVGEFVTALQGLGDTSLQSAINLESLQRTLNIFEPGKANETLAFLDKQAAKLGINLETTREAYANFLAVTRFTPIRGELGKGIFTELARTFSVRGLNAEEQQRAFTGFEQILSKQFFSAEEYRQQLGEIPGLDFQGVLSRATGLNPQQLEQGIKDKNVFAIFPKIAAQYQAENSAIGQSSDTAAQAINRFNNAALKLRENFQTDFLDIKKIGLSGFTSALEGLAEQSKILSSFLKDLVSVWLLKLAVNLAKGAFATLVVKEAWKGLVSLFQASLPILGKIALEFALFTAAFEVVSANLYIAKGGWQEYQKELDATTERVTLLKNALEELKDQDRGETTGYDLPKNTRDIISDRTFKLFGVDTGVNIDKLRIRQFLGGQTTGGLDAARFQESVGLRGLQINENLIQSPEVLRQLKEAQELERQLTQVRSRRFNLNLKDKDAYNKNIEDEERLLKLWQEKLKASSRFSANLEADKTATKKSLEELEKKAANRQVTRDIYDSTKSQLENQLNAIEQVQKAFTDVSSRLEVKLDALGILIRNITEQAAYFNETLDRESSLNKAQITKKGREKKTGSSVLAIQLNEEENRVLGERVKFYAEKIKEINRALEDPEYAAALRELQKQATDLGINLENTTTIDRLLAENRSDIENRVLTALKQQLDYKNQFAQNSEQLEQGLSNQKSAVTDLNRTINDYFQQITQQIGEARIEVEKVVNSLRYGDIRLQLQRALVPGGNSFVSGIIQGVQGLLDQAQGIVEQFLGQRQSRIAFAGEKYSIENQLIDFSRSIGGAIEALGEFRNSLLSDGKGNQTNSNSSQLSPTNPAIGNDTLSSRARFFQQQLIRVREQNINLNDQVVQQEFKKFLLSLQQSAAEYNRQLADNIRSTQSAIIESRTQFNDLIRQYSGQTLSSQLQIDLQAIESSFRSYKNQLFEQERGLSDTITELTNFIQSAPKIIAQLRASGNEIDRAQADFLEKLVAQFRAQIPLYQNWIKELKGIGNQLEATQRQAIAFAQKQAQLRKIQSNLDRTNLEVSIAQQSYDISGERDALLEQARLELEQKKKQAELDFADDPAELKKRLELYQQEYDLKVKTAEFNYKITRLNRENELIQQRLNAAQTAGNLEQIRDIKLLQERKQLEIDLLNIKREYPDPAEQQERINARLQQNVLTEQQIRVDYARERAGRDLELINQKVTEAQALGNLEQIRSLRLLQEEKQAELDILEIQQKTSNPAEQGQFIEQRRRLEAINKRNIEYEYQTAKRNRELELIRGQLNEHQTRGNLETVRTLRLLEIQKQTEIDILDIKQRINNEAERNRLINQRIIQGQLEARQADYDFRNSIMDRRQENRDIDSEIAQNQAELTRDPYQAAQIREQDAIANENLAYQQRYAEIQQQYADNSQRKNELLDKETEAHIQRLQLLDKQYLDLGESIGMGLSDASTSFIQALLQGQNALEAFGQALGNSLIEIGGNLIKSGFDSLFGGAFGFKYGGEVPNYSLGGAIADAFRREGPGAVLGVFHKGEHFLSDLTGEAQRYRALEKKLGKHPLKKIPTFSLGGPVDLASSLSNGLSTQSNLSFNYTSLNSGTKKEQVSKATININVTTPDVGGFKRTERQLGRLVREYGQRGG